MSKKPEAPALPVTVEHYAIGLLAEECGEVCQMAGKWLRFGPDHARHDGLTSRKGLNTEAGDLLAAIDYAIGAGVLDESRLADRRAYKFAKLTDPSSTDDQGNRLAPPIPALNPPEVDPALQAAREMFAERHRQGLHDIWRGGSLCKGGAASAAILNGELDKHGTLLLIHAAIKRGLTITQADAGGVK